MSNRSKRRAASSHWIPANRAARRAASRFYVTEALERRVMLADTPAWVLGAPPTWQDEGPIWETDAQVEGLGYRHDPVSGAVNAIAADPIDYAKIYVASVNGG